MKQTEFKPNKEFKQIYNLLKRSKDLSIRLIDNNPYIMDSEKGYLRLNVERRFLQDISKLVERFTYETNIT